ncbi:MAG: hypothetical protein PHU51_01905, partial [Candidatus Nanoarchaeia archaeon]|nr:hypothetical protein [Candidatus Nanoarchaeia archaeon]
MNKHSFDDSLKRYSFLVFFLLLVGVVSSATYITSTYVKTNNLQADTADYLTISDNTYVNGYLSVGKTYEDPYSSGYSIEAENGIWSEGYIESFSLDDEHNWVGFSGVNEAYLGIWSDNADSILQVGNVPSYYVGTDYSDSEKFKIGATNFEGNSFVMDSSGNILMSGSVEIGTALNLSLNSSWIHTGNGG